MTQRLRTPDRTRLMIGCGGTAMALALAFAPQTASAQGIQATPNVVAGSATITQPNATTTQIDVGAGSAVIDWNAALDAGGNALDFLRTGATAVYQNNQGANFAVLNRILPSPNNNIVVIDGNVISRVGSAAAGFGPGGFVAFYSPTGILVGPNATFDVGSLMLTTLDMTPANFASFANGNFATLQGAPGSVATITVSPGAQINATRENSFFAVVAADVEMRGAAFVNGSQAYVAGEVVGMRYSNGLFDIFVPTGTAASGEVVTLNGTIGGPSSNGAGDNHVIYAVARATTDPISMLLTGNIGFAPAQSAGIVNGEIILAANYNVFGRQVGGGAIGQDVGSVTFSDRPLDGAQADITLQDFAASSSLLAIGSGRTLATSVNADSSVLGNFMLFGRRSATIDAAGPRSFTVSGDVLVDSRDFGVSGSGLQSLDVINAQAGTAQILARNPNALVSIGGRAIVTADAFGGVEINNRIAGFARAGTAEIVLDGGRLSVAGGTLVGASAFGTTSFVETGAEARGGIARMVASTGGRATLSGDIAIRADATAANGVTFTTSTPSNAFGGTARLAIDGSGAIGVRGSVSLGANALAQASNAAGAGAIADAGEASVSVDGNNLLDITGDLTILANAAGGENRGGTGGLALGGAARAVTRNGGQITVGGAFLARAEADGGFGNVGGNAFGGIAGANAITGAIAIGTDATANATARGGGAIFGFGGNGGTGRGGNAFFQADGAAGSPALLTIGGNADLRADGSGGEGGASDNQAILAGRGGDGFGGDLSTPNQADPAFRSGAFLLAGGDYGRIAVTGSSFVFAQGSGGRGGGGFGNGPFAPGRGGNGVGGLAQAGLALLGGPGTVGGGSALFGDLVIDSAGFGGTGGIDGFVDQPGGVAGNGQGGTSVLTVRAGTVTAGLTRVDALGLGGTGGTGGSGTGGTAAVQGGFGGSLNVIALEVLAQGSGGFGLTGAGGNGFGGTAAFEIDGMDATIDGALTIDASGIGTGSVGGASGNGRGGTGYIATTGTAPGTLTVAGHTSVFANGIGGDSGLGFAAGNGQGGLAYVDALGGGQMSFVTAQIAAVGRGGDAVIHEGGDGTGGTVRLRASGTGSSIAIQRNVSASVATESPAGAALLSANGFGANTFGGDGIGGAGLAGVVEVRALTGGTLNLPVDILADPLRGSDSLFIFARGIAGDTSVDGGAGGLGVGGTVDILVDGGTLVSGTMTPSAFGQGGSSANPSANITGGAAFGGSRFISVTNGGTLTTQTNGGGAGAQGGNGSGTGNGGDATAGAVLFQVINSVANITGSFDLFNATLGGSGQRGGNAGGGSIIVNTSGAQINFTPDASGTAALSLSGTAVGGNGIVAGGNAAGTTVNVTMASTQLIGAALLLDHVARGGDAAAANGVGGNATGAAMQVGITGSNITLPGGITFTADAIGGAGGANGTGGAATGGSAGLTLTDSNLVLASGGNLIIRANGTGGVGGAVGAGTGGQASLALTRSALTAGQVLILAQGIAGGRAGTLGGNAVGGQALVTLSGNASLDAGAVEIDASGSTTPNGTARGGSASLQLATGSTARLTAATLRLIADAVGGVTNTAGRFSAVVGGGNVNLGSLTGSAAGNALAGGLPASELAATGGNLNVSGILKTLTFGDILLRTAQGGVIGNLATAGNTASFDIAAGGTIQTTGDGSAGSGLGAQSMTFGAGRSILLGGNITGRGGAITFTANNGGGQALASPPVSVITMAAGSRIDAGTGTVTMRLLDGAGNPQRVNGAITLASITAGRIDVRNLGTSPGSNISVLASGVLSASGSGRAIDLASLNGEVINLAGDAGLVLTGGGHYGIFAATPTGSQIGSFANYARRYNVANAAAYDALNPGGNFAAFRIVPFLTVTPATASRFYGSANPAFTINVTGFLPGDGIANLSGAAQFTTLAGATSNVGQYAVNASLGTLLSAQGYQFLFAPGVLNVTPRPITVTANNLSRLYGNANPALTFTVGGQGLVNGDQLTGALATAANGTTGVGNVLITQGTLAASGNYALTFVNGQLAITPRQITVTGDSFSKFLGLADPTFTYKLGGDGLVNGDVLTGSLIRDAGERLGVFAIRQGTLGAGPNYTITYVGGQLTIDPPPVPPGFNNPITFEPPITIGGQKPPVSDEDERRYGIDFPERPDAALITEDPLLDDPVTSGADAAVYGDTAPPAGGGK